ERGGADAARTAPGADARRNQGGRAAADGARRGVGALAARHRRGDGTDRPGALSLLPEPRRVDHRADRRCVPRARRRSGRGARDCGGGGPRQPVRRDDARLSRLGAGPSGRIHADLRHADPRLPRARGGDRSRRAPEPRPAAGAARRSLAGGEDYPRSRLCRPPPAARRALRRDAARSGGGSGADGGPARRVRRLGASPGDHHARTLRPYRPGRRRPRTVLRLRGAGPVAASGAGTARI
ncbi:MAG: Transcriptional regulator, AcrR family, partial [uncultured Thermomicrobiales bacterium]